MENLWMKWKKGKKRQNVQVKGSSSSILYFSTQQQAACEKLIKYLNKQNP